MAHDTLPIAIDGMRPAREAAAVGLRIELPHAIRATQIDATFAFIHPDAGLTVVARGEVARLEGRSLPEAARILGGLSRDPGIEWLDGDALPPPPGPWLAAVAFDPNAALDQSWSGFAPARFILPALLCWTQGGRHFAAAFAAGLQRSRELLRTRLDELRVASAANAGAADFSITRSESLPAPPSSRARAAWAQVVGAALDEIRAGRLDKVVVGRAQELTAAKPWNPAVLVEALAEQNPSCRAFLVRGDDGAHFVGATPELLCAIDGRELRAEAVAGSAPPSDARQLLVSAKDLREHRWVVEHLVLGLRPLADSLSLPPEPGIRLLTHVAHLVTPIRARLSAGVDAGDVVAALHPTPAVCGVPAAAALSFLARHEGLGRGLYAGLVGLVGPGRTELAVALRSALLRGSTARVFAGAGIVEGSVAGAELRETELKTAALLCALAATAPREPEA